MYAIRSYYAPILLPELAPKSALEPRPSEMAGVVSLIAFPFPPVRPIGVLVSVWFRRGCREDMAQLVPVLRSVGELTGAAMGNVDVRRSLADTIKRKTREANLTARMHAREMTRRDAVEEEISYNFV